MRGLKIGAVVFATAATCAGSAKAEPCFGSFFAITPTVCGDAFSGGSSTTTANTTANPVLHMENGLAVSVGAVSAGNGIFGAASASGTFGEVHSFTSANMDASVTTSGVLSAIDVSRAYIGYVDGFDIGGTSPVTVHVKSTIEGSFEGIAEGAVSFMLERGFEFPLLFLFGKPNLAESERKSFQRSRDRSQA